MRGSQRDQRLAHARLHAAVQLRGVRLHHQLPDAAAELGAHDALAGTGAEDDLRSPPRWRPRPSHEARSRPSRVGGRPETPSRGPGSRHIDVSATDEHLSRGDTVPTGRSTGSLQVLRAIAGAGRRLAVDLHRRAALGDRGAVGGRIDERAADRDVRRRVGGGAVTVAAGMPPIVTSALTAAVDDAAERVRHRHRRGRARRLDQVDVDAPRSDRPGALPAVPCDRLLS